MTDNENAANILLQRLVREVTKLWNGEPSEIKNAEEAYAMCREIYELTNEEREHDGMEGIAATSGEEEIKQ